MCSEANGKKVAYRDILEEDIGNLAISHLSILSSINMLKASIMHLLHNPVPHHRLKGQNQVDLEHFLHKESRILFFVYFLSWVICLSSIFPKKFPGNTYRILLCIFEQIEGCCELHYY